MPHKIWGLQIFGNTFKLCNAPLTFTTLMNIISQEEMNDFVIIYINDILVYSKIAEEHMQHLEVVIGKLKENKLYANGKKSNFPQNAVTRDVI